MKRSFHRQRLYLITLVLLFPAMATSATAASKLHDFTSDGCSLFPDGDRENRNLWCDCCFAHDIAYWQGGTQGERRQADDTLRDCVLDRTHNKALAILMYDGVRSGGHPAFPTWYRWAYGWSYGRGYKALTEEERQQAKEKLDEYGNKHPAGYCGSRSDKMTPDEKERP